MRVGLKGSYTILHAKYGIYFIVYQLLILKRVGCRMKYEKTLCCNSDFWADALPSPGGLYALQKLAELLSGNSPVTNLILDIVTHFGKGLGIAFGDEYRVIAETCSTFSYFDDFSIDDSLEIMFFAVCYQCKNGTKPGFSVCYAFKIV